MCDEERYEILTAAIQKLIAEWREPNQPTTKNECANELSELVAQVEGDRINAVVNCTAIDCIPLGSIFLDRDWKITGIEKAGHLLITRD